MTQLPDTLDGEAKKVVEMIGTSGIFKATALKTLKRDFGIPLLISHFPSKELIEKPQMRVNKWTVSLQQFDHGLKSTTVWLMLVGYKVPILSNENLTTAIILLPYQLCQRFFKFIKESNLIDGSIALLNF